MDTNIQNIAYLGKIMSLCNKQHLSNIRGSIELKKYFAFKKGVFRERLRKIITFEET